MERTEKILSTKLEILNKPKNKEQIFNPTPIPVSLPPLAGEGMKQNPSLSPFFKMGNW
jgi:hypothetical protein